MLVPLIIIVSNIIKMWPNIKKFQTPTQKTIGYTLYLLLISLFGVLSANLPIVISLYWLASDISNSVLDFFIHKFLSKNKTISGILAQYEEEVKKAELEKAEEEVLEDVKYLKQNLNRE